MKVAQPDVQEVETDVRGRKRRGAARRRGIDVLREQQIHRRVTLSLQLLLFLGAGVALLTGQFLAAVTTIGILIVTLLPMMLGRRLKVYIPPEFELLTVLFIFASLFLGEVRDYYVRFWWWDAVLHAASGFLLGVLGFLLVYVLNEKEDLEMHMKPAFVALFAFTFAVGLGALWEIFEFAMDNLFGLNMQKSGLVDTMWDLIVDTVGALVISILGYGYLRTSEHESFLVQWILRFVKGNPRLFRKG